jgi:hypothetical protein
MTGQAAAVLNASNDVQRHFLSQKTHFEKLNATGRTFSLFLTFLSESLFIKTTRINVEANSNHIVIVRRLASPHRRRSPSVWHGSL